MKIESKNTIKTLIINGSDQPIAIVIRGDHELNTIKASKIPGASLPVTMASPEDIKKFTGFELGYLGPINLDIPIYFDHAVNNMSDFVCGANEEGYHFAGVNFEKDIKEAETLDLRVVKDGDLSPLGKGKLKITRGIEVGHIFQLGTKYSEALNATVQDNEGNDTPMAMGCYGIGISRIVGAAIEQNHDEKGIMWPETLAPFKIIIIPIGLDRSEIVKKTTNDLYNQMLELGFEVLLDDRNVRPGVKFADAELIGIPHRVVISEKGVEKNNIEYRHRSQKDSEMMTVDNLMKLTSH